MTPTNAQFETITLNKVAFGLSGRVSSSFIGDMKATAEHVGEDIAYQVRGMVLSSDVKTETMPRRSRHDAHREIRARSRFVVGRRETPDRSY